MTTAFEVIALVGFGCMAVGMWLYSPALSLTVCGGLVFLLGTAAAWCVTGNVKEGSDDN